MTTADRVQLRISDPNPREIDLLLGADFDAEHTAQGTTLTDYRTWRVLETEGSGHTDRSLLGLLSFRYFECSNRLSIHQILEAGGANDEEHPYLPGLSRHELGQGGPEHLDEIAWTGAAATCEGRTVFSSVLGEIEASMELRHRLARYLRRTVAGHPAIYQRVLRERMPPELRFTFWQEPREVTVEILALSGTDLRPTLLGPVHSRAEDALQACMDEARRGGPFTDADEDALMQRVRSHVDAKRWLPALLCAFEWGWCRRPLPEKLQNAVPKLIGVDPNSQRLVDLITGKIEVDLEARVAEILSLGSAACELGHCLDVFAGSLFMNEDGERGEAFLLKALKQNPRLAGPYHDLGLIHASRYAFDDAYRCWDFARWLSPEHPIMSDVDDREADVVQAERALPFGSMAFV